MSVEKSVHEVLGKPEFLVVFIKGCLHNKVSSDGLLGNDGSQF